MPPARARQGRADRDHVRTWRDDLDGELVQVQPRRHRDDAVLGGLPCHRAMGSRGVRADPRAGVMAAGPRVIDAGSPGIARYRRLIFASAPTVVTTVAATMLMRSTSV